MSGQTQDRAIRLVVLTSRLMTSRTERFDWSVITRAPTANGHSHSLSRPQTSRPHAPNTAMPRQQTPTTRSRTRQTDGFTTPLRIRVDSCGRLVNNNLPVPAVPIKQPWRPSCLTIEAKNLTAVFDEEVSPSVRIMDALDGLTSSNYSHVFVHQDVTLQLVLDAIGRL